MLLLHEPIPYCGPLAKQLFVLLSINFVVFLDVLSGNPLPNNNLTWVIFDKIIGDKIMESFFIGLLEMIL